MSFQCDAELCKPKCVSFCSKQNFFFLFWYQDSLKIELDLQLMFLRRRLPWLSADSHVNWFSFGKFWLERKPKRVFRLLTSDFQLQTSEFRLPASGFKLQTSDVILQTSDLTKCELRISDFWPIRLKAEWLDLRTSHFPLPTSHFPLPTFDPDFWLPTSDFRLPTFDFGLLTSNFRFPTSDIQLPTSDIQLLSSNFRLLTWLSVLLGSIAARSTTRVLMAKVQAQWKGRLYRSRHKREQLNLLLKKQLSTKPTRQPMRFAWRTETMVLPDHTVAITKQSKHC